MKPETFEKLWEEAVWELNKAEVRSRKRLLPRDWAKEELRRMVTTEPFGAAVLEGPGVGMTYPGYNANTTKLVAIWIDDEYAVRAYRGEARRGERGLRFPIVRRVQPWHVAERENEKRIADKAIGRLDRLIRAELAGFCLPSSRLLDYTVVRNMRERCVTVWDEKHVQWFCWKYLCVPAYYGDDALSALRGAGFSLDEADKIIAGEASKEEIEAWSAMAALREK